MNIIKKLDLVVDTDLIQQDLDKILTYTTWGSHNQIGLNHRANAENIWFDNIGGLFDSVTKQRLARESDFDQWSPAFPTYVKTAIEMLEQTEGFKAGRIRFMRGMPKTGLSYHIDEQDRYHLVIETNPGAFFIGAVEGKEEIAHCFHIPRDNHFYKVNTTQHHTVYNSGNDPRIHLVICKR
jgi:hypothetical protein